MFITSVEQAEATAIKLQRRIPRRIAMSKVRDMVARIYGYDDWGHFLGSPHTPLSPFDDEIDQTERVERTARQAEFLTEFGFSSRAAKEFLKDVRPTFRTKEHEDSAKRDRRLVVRRVLEHLNKASKGDKMPERVEEVPEKRVWPLLADRLSKEEKERIVGGPRHMAEKASVRENSKFRGISIKTVRNVLKCHAISLFPPLSKTASRSDIWLDLRVAFGLHEELYSCGFLERGATENDILALGGRDAYSIKPAHITDKGKSIFRPGSRGILRTSYRFDPDAPVDLNDFSAPFSPSDATWFAGRIRPSAYFRGDLNGMIHETEDQQRYDHIPYLTDGNILSDRNPFNEKRQDEMAFDGRERFAVALGSEKREMLVVSRHFEESPSTWKISMKLDWTGRKIDADSHPLYGEQQTELTLQSMVAVFMGADLWRLAHRRRGLDGQQTITADIELSKSCGTLGRAISTLAAERKAFVGHIPDEISGAIEIIVRMP